MVGLDVGGGRRLCFFEGLELRAPDQALLQLREPRLDEGLRLGVAVAATTVGDLRLLEAGAESRVRYRRCRCRCRGSVGRARRLGRRRRPRLPPRPPGVGTQVEAEGRNLAGAAVDDRVQVAQPCSATQMLVMSMYQSCFGRSTRKIAWRLICITRATTATLRPRATSGRGRATRSLYSQPRNASPRPHRPFARVHARGRGSSSASPSRPALVVARQGDGGLLR